MAKPKVFWQHKVPQRGMDHIIVPKARPWPCLTCGERIIRVDGDEGPEALKALFRF